MIPSGRNGGGPATGPAASPRPPAPHVRAAVAATAQAKPSPAGVPAPAPHVRAAMAATAPAVQPQARPASRPAPAAHVQAAMAAVAQPRTRPPGGPVPAAHVQGATVQAKPREAGVRAAPLPPPSAAAVLQLARGVKRTNKERGMDEEEQRYHRRRSKRKKVEVKRLGVTTDLEKIDRGIEIEEQRAWEKKQKKLKENLEKFKLELSLAPPTHGSEQITYVTGTGKKQTEDEVTSLPISKELMSQSYAKAMTTGLEMTFFHIGANLEDEDNERFMKQHFVLQQGHDYLVVPLVPQGGGSYRREGKGPTFDELAEKADAAAQWLLENYGNVYKRLSQALRRVARDINNLAGGRPSKVSYPLDLTMGAGGLASFAAVIRADKGRVTKATKYIESILKSGKKSFAKRFGGKNPKYVGTGSGTGSGPERLRSKALEYPGEDSEYSDMEE